MPESGDFEWNQAEFPVDLKKILSSVDFNKPETISAAFAEVAQTSVKEKHPVAKATGISLKYLGDAFECAVADAKRQDINPGDFASGMANAIGIAFGFLSMGLSNDDEQYDLVREGLADTIREALYTFGIIHPDSQTQTSDRAKKPKSVPEVAMRIDAPGTVH